MLAAVGYMGKNPVVTGFLFPQVSQMTHDDPKLRMDRHQSDVITTIDGDGNIQLAHPSGLFIKIGSEPGKVDFTGRNTDKNLLVDRNTETTPYVCISMANSTAVLTIAPNGSVTLTTETTIDVTAQGNINVTTKGSAHVTASESATVTTPQLTIDATTTNITNDLNVGRNLVVAGSTAVQAITAEGSDIGADHGHEGVVSGSDVSGPTVGS
jgi:hypothetical protein